MPVMTEEKRQVLASFRDVPLAAPFYGNPSRPAYYAEDLLHPASLAYIIDEIVTYEAELTEDGGRFLSAFYGLDALLAQLELGGMTDENGTLAEALQALMPRETQS